MRVRRATAIGIGAVTVLAGTALPAMANNVDLVVGGAHHGIWTDSTDNLGACLGGSIRWVKAVASIRPADGSGPKFSITDTTAVNGCVFTGNLSIPEDELYIMTVTAYPSQTPVVSDSISFYT